MCILVSALDEYVYSCVGSEQLCVLCRFWTTMCISAPVLDDSVHSCVGFA